MKDRDFQELLESVREMVAIARGERKPVRVTRYVCRDGCHVSVGEEDPLHPEADFSPDAILSRNKAP